jgi:hypothetical protein
MKIKTIIALILFSINGMAQVTLQPERDIDDPNQRVSGYYYTDMYNVLDPFVGTYLYTNGNTSFKIILQKKQHSSVGIYFEDMLIGGYRYVENGVVKVDVLNDLANNFARGTSHKISGRVIMTGNKYGWTDCAPNEKWIYGSIEDPVSGSVDTLFIFKRIVGGQEALKIFILHSIGFKPEGSPTPIPISYPISQEIILIKQ